MGQVISEGLEHIGSISNDGYVYDTFGEVIAKIDESGYIRKWSGGGYFGRIDKDGTIRDASGSVVGNIQADGYVYIHSKRVCNVDSDFIRNITPDAKNYGHPTEYPNRRSTVKSSYDDSPAFNWPLSFGATVKIIVGIIIWVWFAFDTGFESLGFLECLAALPMCIVGVFMVCFIFKLFNQ